MLRGKVSSLWADSGTTVCASPAEDMVRTWVQDREGPCCVADSPRSGVQTLKLSRTVADFLNLGLLGRRKVVAFRG